MLEICYNREYERRWFRKKYTANVFVKDELKEITNREKDKPQRIIGEELKDYLFESEDTKVCILYGLRRTGKTTLMLPNDF